MENNWKWYEQSDSEQQAQQNAQNAQNPQDAQRGYNAYQSYHGNNNNGYDPYGGYAQSYRQKPSKPKKYVTLTQMIVAIVVAAFLFTGAGLLIGKGSSSNSNNTAQQEVNNTEHSSEPEATEPAANSSSNDPAIKPSSGLSSAATHAGQDDTKNVVQACMSSVVSIDIEAEVYNGRYWYSNGDSTAETVGSGSGVILTSDGYIVTNNHVVAGAEKLKVYLQDGTEYEAELIGTDSYTDLAVIKIAAENLPAAVLGSSNESMVGDTVYAIGNPLGVLATSVSKGIVSGLDREITLDNKQMTLMQVNASVNPGNSGGGLFNADGELIGIVNSKASGNNVEGIGFAIPMDTAKPVISDLMDHGYVTGRPYIGIVMQNVTFSTGGYGFFGGGYTTHPQIYSIEAGSSAEKAGLKVNDIILAFDGETVNSSSDISAKLYGYKVGDMVTITVQRGSEKIDVTLTLGERAS